MSAVEGPRDFRTKAERTRLKNEHLRLRVLAVQEAREAEVAAPTTKRKRAPAEHGYGRDKSAVEWLHDKGKLTSAQKDMGERYGAWWRGASIEGAHILRSCLDDSARGGGGSGLPPDASENAEWIAGCRAKLERAHQALGYVTGMVAPLILICGHGKRVKDIPEIASREEVAEVETGLRLALEALISYERAHGQF